MGIFGGNDPDEVIGDNKEVDALYAGDHLLYSSGPPPISYERYSDGDLRYSVTGAGANDTPLGLAHDGTNFWVSLMAGSSFLRVARLTAPSSGNTWTTGRLYVIRESNAIGLSVDSTYFWIGNTRLSRVKRFNISSGSAVEFNFVTNINPRCFFSNGTTLWVARNDVQYFDGGTNDMGFATTIRRNILQAYNVSNMQKDTSKDVLLDLNNDQFIGLYYDGSNWWVGDDGETKIFAYTASSGVTIGPSMWSVGARDSSKDYDDLGTDGFKFPADIVRVDGTMYVIDRLNPGRILAYR